MSIIGSGANLASRNVWLWKNGSIFCRPVERRLPQLAVDVSGVLRHDARTGIQRVVRSVWLQLRAHSGEEFEIVPVYATRAHGYCYAAPDFLSDERRPQPEPVRLAAGDRFLGLDLSADLLPKYRRQVAAWRSAGASIHVVVYDLLPLLRPGWFNESTVARFRTWFSFVEEQCDQALCISDDVFRQVQARFLEAGHTAIAAGRIHMGNDIEASAPSVGVDGTLARLLGRFDSRPAILMVGTIEPRKGYDVALRAFDVLWRREAELAPDLVIVGKAGWKTSVLQTRIRSHEELGKRLHWLDQATDEGLCRLYKCCRGLLVTSYGEGFGLPLLEAARYGSRILARGLPVFREQDLPNASYFENDDPETLANAIMSLAEPRTQAAVRPSLRSWADSTQDLLQTLKTIRRQPALPGQILMRRYGPAF